MGVSINNGQPQPQQPKQSWLKKGQASAQAAKHNEQEIQRRREEQGLMWRYYLKQGEGGELTFVDGDLSVPEGFLWPPRYYEHDIYWNGKFHNFFVCPEKTSPESGDKCPLCEDPQERPYLAALFTVIDHRKYTNPENGKIYQNQRRLLVAKTQTFEILAKIANKVGGLAGQTFDVSRSNAQMSANVGDVFIPLKKTPIIELQKLYMAERTDPKTNAKTKETYFLPANYETEIVYRTGDELRKMGLGKPVMATGTQQYQEGEQAGYKEHL
jgi:hypothetical protein